MLITILTFLLVLGFLVLIHELGHFLTARWLGVAVEELGLGFPPRLISKKIKETVYSLNLIPLGGFVKIKGEDGENTDSDSFGALPVGRRMLIITAGVIMNLVGAWLLIIILFLTGAPAEITAGTNPNYVKEKRVLITQVISGSPAQEAGIIPGDEIISVGGRKIDNHSELQKIIAASEDSEIKFLLQRENRTIEIELVPKILELEKGESRISAGVGVISVGKIKLPFLQAVKQGSIATIGYLQRILAAIGGIFKSLWLGQGLSETIGGPVAIAVVAGSAAAAGLSQVLSLTAILSLNLAIINILPFPALDGGRLVFLLVEKIRGRPSRRLVEAWLHQLGFILLILFAIFITYRDLLRIGEL